MKYIKLIIMYLFSISICLANQWGYLGGKTLDIDNVLINSHDTKIIYVSTGQKLFKSNDSGITWIDIWSDSAYSIIDIAMNPQNTNVVFVLTENKNSSQLYKSEDGGEIWHLKHTFNSRGITGFKINNHNPSILYTVQLGHPFFSKSFDGGESWKELESGETSFNTTSIEVDPQNPDVIFIGSRGSSFTPAGVGGIYKSIDQGLSWQLLFSDSMTIGSEPDSIKESIPIAINPHNTKIIYFGNPDKRSGTHPNYFLSHQVLKTTNGGGVWEKLEGLPDDITIEAIVIDPHNPENVYLGTQTGLYRTANNGQNWSLLSKKIDGKELSIKSIAIDPQNPEILYIGTLNEGLYKLETDSSCEANFDNTTAIVNIPCLIIDGKENIFEVDLQKNNTENYFNLIDIKLR